MTRRDRSEIALRRPHNPRALPPIVLPLLIGMALLLGGLDGAMGKPALCLGAALLLGWQVHVGMPGGPFLRAVAPVGLCLAGAFAWAAAASIGLLTGGAEAGALAPDLANRELVGLIGYYLLLLTAAIAGFRSRNLNRSIDALLLIGTGVTIIGLLLRLTIDSPLSAFWTLARDGRFLGTLNNANVAAVSFGAIAILAFARLLQRDRAGRWLGVAFYWACLAINISALIYTASRATMTFCSLGLLALALLAWRRGEGRGQVLGQGAAMIGLILLALSAQFAYRLFMRFGMLGQHADSRIALWEHLARIADASPVHGYGLGTYPVLHGRYLDIFGQPSQIWMINSPHDIILHLLLGAGWPYLILIGMATALIGVAILRRQMRAGLAMAELGAIVATLMILACSTVDIGLEVPAIATLALILVGLVWGRAIRPVGVHLRPALTPVQEEGRIGI